MALGKQAKVLSRAQVDGGAWLRRQDAAPASAIELIFLLSAKAGLRAKEIASLTWDDGHDRRR